MLIELIEIDFGYKNSTRVSYTVGLYRPILVLNVSSLWTEALNAPSMWSVWVCDVGLQKYMSTVFKMVFTEFCNTMLTEL